MNLEKEDVIVGYAAFTADGKGLCNRWSGGYQTGTNVQSLTDDMSKVSIAPDKHQVETYIIWFNNTHKNKVYFTIKEVKYIVKSTLQIL